MLTRRLKAENVQHSTTTMARSGTVSPMPWRMVKNIIETGDLVKLGRSYEQQEVYNSFRAELNTKWRSVGDYILCSKFKFPSGPSTQEGKLVAIPPVEHENQCKDSILLVPNDFPYNFEPGIQHHVLWKLGSPLSACEIEGGVDQLRRACPTITDYAT